MGEEYREVFGVGEGYGEAYRESQNWVRFMQYYQRWNVIWVLNKKLSRYVEEDAHRQTGF